ncbi:fungal-specific transcription factor domain-containing protein [Amylostereum chailletii]|nr:fungal-specific transcription factor domain-containing protein [Amylostereum chailletii]
MSFPRRVLMAHAERLTQQVKTMSARIKELEDALAKTQNGSQSHPLLRDVDRRDGGAIVSELEGTFAAEMEEVAETIGSLSIGLDGKTKYHGETAGSEYLQTLIQKSDPSRTLSNPKFLGLPADIIDLVNSFPFGLRDHNVTAENFKHFIPPRSRTDEVVNMYYENASWFYDPVPRPELTAVIIEPIYQAVNGFMLFKSLHAHHLSIFFMVLATGLLFNKGQSAPILVDQFHAMACAAFSMDSITRGASCASVQAMILMIHFSYWTDRNGSELRWLHNGMCVRIAQMIGLQRDSAGWNLDKEEVQRRRVVFWEFYNWDAWSSVITGRPPALNLSQSDCRFPEDTDSVRNSSGQLEWGWHTWKFHYAATCLSPSVQRAFAVRPPNYTSLIELDKRIRAFPLPEHLRPGTETGHGWNTSSSEAMKQFCAVCMRESNLLYIHRAYFVQAIRESADPLQHKFGQSVLAAYRSTRALISGLKGLYAVHPTLTSRVWFFWSGIYSSCVVLGAIVVESPGCKLVQSALAELDQACAFYEEGSARCRPPATLPMLHTFQKRAHHAFAEYHSKKGTGAATTPPRDSSQDQLDELEVLGGRQSVINQNQSSPTSVKSSSSSIDRSPTMTGSRPAATYGAVDTNSHDTIMTNAQVHEGGSQRGGAPSHQLYDYSWMTTAAAPVNTRLRPVEDFNQSYGPPTTAYPLSAVRRAEDTGYQLSSGQAGMTALPNPATSSNYGEYNGYGQIPMQGQSYTSIDQQQQQQQIPVRAQAQSQTQDIQGVDTGGAIHQLPAGMGYQEDIWRDFVHHLGMRGAA